MICCHFQKGALSGLLATAASRFNPIILPWLSIYGGLFCLFLWFFGLVDYLMVIPSSVVHGFVSALFNYFSTACII
jgi:MFS superfamily sulfate permease-like transporter